MITIDYTLIIVILNFLVLLVILNRLLYKPINRFLQERSEKIAQDIKEAGKAKEEAQKMVEQKEKDLRMSAAEIRKTKKAAKKEAEKKAEEILTQAKEHERKIIKDTNLQLTHEREKAISQIEHEMSDMIANLSSKFLSEKMDSKKDREAIANLLKKRSKN
ncbi:MAG: F0F1 ATP synthase subunit B [Candidatus Cloacimonetes bacterium]|nr:F0F1 ATP synthase subunit B [Candidatus Cloacimonadota bacterium]